MRDAMLWMAIASVAVASATFIAAMLLFFRARRGSWPLRLSLVASTFAGIVVILVALAEQESINLVAFTAGMALMTISYGLFWWAIHAHGRSRPSAAFALDPPDALVVHGPYAFIRHPFYAAYVLAAAGGAAFVSAWWAWGVPAWLWMLYWYAAMKEEATIVQSDLGGPYRAYRLTTGRFVPRLGGRGKPRPSATPNPDTSTSA